jgi:hypothetical protein
MPDPIRLLHCASWQAEKLFKARGWLRTMVWVTEAKDGRRQMFETACEAERTELSDDEALAALCADLRAVAVSFASQRRAPRARGDRA